MKLWDIKAFCYHRVRRLFVFRRMLEDEIRAQKSLMDTYPNRHDFVLDLGCGTGCSLQVFPDDVPVIGMDHSLRMVRRAFRYRKGFAGVVGSADHLPFKKNCTTMISAVGLIEYLKDKIIFIDEIHSVLKKSGTLLITVSPPSFLNKLRNLFGNRIYPVKPEHWKKTLVDKGWTCLMKEIQCFRGSIC